MDPVWIVVTGLAAVVLGYLALVAFAGLHTPPALGSNPDPTRDRTSALARLEALRARDGADVAEPCRTALLEPDGPAKATIVYLHGFTNCPNQFAPTAAILRDRGYRILSVRHPRHGLSDLLNHELKDITAEELVATADEAIDIAVGFGDEVCVFGFSGGGVLACWAAATREGISRVAAASPVASPKGVPIPLARLLVRFHSFVPPVWIWWNPAKKADLGESPYVYPGFHLPALVPYLRLANLLADRKVIAAYPLTSAVLLFNPGDFAVRRDAAVRLMGRTFAETTPHAQELSLDKGLGWWHDFIDQDGPHHATPVQVADVVLSSLGLADETAGGMIVSARPIR